MTPATSSGNRLLHHPIICDATPFGVATTVTTPVLIAILATIAGVIVVGAGGGLIKPMQTRWGAKVEGEASKIRQEARNAPSVKEQAWQAKAKHDEADSSSPPTTRATGYYVPRGRTIRFPTR